MGEAAEALEAFAEARAKFDEEIAEKVAAYEAVRAEQREKEDEEIRQLKEKQEKRREERAKEEDERREREREEEARRKQEEEERKKKMLEEKARREANKRKSAKDAFALAGGPIVIQKREGGGEEEEKKSKRQVGPSPEELEAQKQAYLSSVTRPTDLTCMGPEDIKRHIERLHEKVCKIVADTYDLEKRTEAQDYDYKELIGRQKQQARAKAIRMGLDPDEAERSKHPPKLKIVTKYDRQIDRRGYKDRMAVFNAPDTAPHFPGVGPPEVKMEKKILEYDDVPAEEGEEGEGEAEEAEAEEEPAAEEEAAEEEEAEEEEEEE